MGHSGGGSGAFIALGIFLLLVGVGFLIWGLMSRARAVAGAAAARSWPMVSGVITAAGVSQHAAATGAIVNPGATPGMASQYYYVPWVRYRYSVGREFEGSRLRFGYITFQNGHSAQAALARYPVGAQVMVRYDAANPAEAVLELEAANSNAMVGIVCGIGAMLFGVLMLVLGASGARF